MSNKGYYSVRNRLWCEKCQKFISFKKPPNLDSDSFNEIMSIFSILDGNLGDAILHSEIGSMKKQVARKELRDYFKCPYCGNPNLVSKVWKGFIKSNTESYKPRDSSTTAGKNYYEGFDKALQYSDLTIEDLEKNIVRYRTGIKCEYLS